MNIEIEVKPARNKFECLQKFGGLSRTMSMAHAAALNQALTLHLGKALNEDTPTHADGALALARNILEAQMQLAQIELFIHNLPD